MVQRIDFLLLLIAAHGTSYIWLAGLDCERTTDRLQVWQGEDVGVTVRITNRRGWPIPWIFIEDYHPSDFPRKGPNKRLAILMPGRSIVIPVDDPSALFIISTAENQDVAWMGV